MDVARDRRDHKDHTWWNGAEEHLFCHAPSTFLHATPKLDSSSGPSIKQALAATKKVGEETLAHNIAVFVRRKAKKSPTFYGEQ